jgi:integrase
MAVGTGGCRLLGLNVVAANALYTIDRLILHSWFRIRDFLESWELSCQAAGVPGLLFHDLRRTAVRNLRRAGVAESVIMKITGHRTRGVFERYNITDQTDTIEAGKAAEEHLSREHSQFVAQITSQTKARPN